MNEISTWTPERGKLVDRFPLSTKGLAGNAVFFVFMLGLDYGAAAYLCYIVPNIVDGYRRTGEADYLYPWPFLALGIVFLLHITVGALRAFRWEVAVYENGLLFIDLIKQRFVPWGDIRAVEEVSGLCMPFRYYRVRIRGSFFPYGLGRVNNEGRLVDMVFDTWSRPLRDRLIADYRAGKAVPFGSVLLQHPGLVGPDLELYQIRDISHVEAGRDTIVIHGTCLRPGETSPAEGSTVIRKDMIHGADVLLELLYSLGVRVEG